MPPDLLHSLCQTPFFRGLRGVRLVTSDSHLGLKQAVAEAYRQLAEEVVRRGE